METNSMLIAALSLWTVSSIICGYYYCNYKYRQDASTFVVSMCPIVNSIIAITVIVSAIIKEFKTLIKDGI